MTFVVAGVSGNTGRVVADRLLSAGRNVRVVVRDAAKGAPWAARGAEDVQDGAAFGRALQGAQGAYVLIPPNMTSPDFRAYQHNVIDALYGAFQGSPVPHAVLLSSVGAQHPDGTGPIAAVHEAEKRFGTLSGTRWSFLRAGYFMENLGASFGALGQGIFPSFSPKNLPIDMIATADIGRVAAELLLEGPNNAGVVELGGPARTIQDAADAISKLMGKTIQVVEAPIDAVVPTLMGYGASASMAGLYRELIEGMNSGRITFENTHRRLQGTTSLEAFLQGALASGASH
jgi:uncharacterized protein YbjT (DUF2867 family)